MFFLRFSGDWQSNRQVTRTTLNYAACLMFYLRFSRKWQSDRQVTWTTLNYAACLMFYLRFSGDWLSDRQVTWTTLNYAACLMLNTYVFQEIDRALRNLVYLQSTSATWVVSKYNKSWTARDPSSIKKRIIQGFMYVLNYIWLIHLWKR